MLATDPDGATMTPALQNARTFDELLRARDERDPYLYASIFRADTWRQRRLAKKKLRLLKRIDGPLRAMLQPGEQVSFVTWGSPISFWEYFAMGWAMYYLNRRAMVLTNRRILLLQVSSRDRPRELRAEIDYRAIAEVKRSGLGNTRISFRSGKSRAFAYIPGADRRFLRETAERLRRALGLAPIQKGIQNLCPHCYRPAESRNLRCAGCGGHFKSPRHAGWLSFILPGAGDLYLGHRAFAVMELIGISLFWIAIAILAWDPTAGVIEVAGLAGFAIGGPHLIDALTTRHIARLGVYPAKRAGGVGYRYALAALVPAGALGLSIIPLSGKGGLTPVARVVAGDSLPPRQVEALRRERYLDPGESLVRFFSPGSYTILEGGSILSDRRVVAYGVDESGRFQDEADYDVIVDLQPEIHPDLPEFSLLAVMRDDGEGFYLVLPTADGQDLAFQTDLAERWRAARRSRDDGLWYDGGDGSTPAEAIEVRGLRTYQSHKDAERWWLTLWAGPEDQAWRWAKGIPLQDDGRVLDQVVIELPGNLSRTFYFDFGRKAAEPD
jgi:hypothetical protein